MESRNAGAITFRVATPEDAERLAGLSARSFREAYQQVWEEPGLGDYIGRAFAPEQIRAELSDPDSTFFLLSRDDQPAGYAKLRRNHNPPGLDATAAVQIQRFYLLAAHYGRGLGDHLMAHCLREAGREGFTTVWLAVWPENTRAVRFYRRWGFAVTGAYPFYHGNEVAQDWLMRKEMRSGEERGMESGKVDTNLPG